MEILAEAIASPLATFTSLLVLIFFVPRLAKLARLPDVVLLIAAGALVGPNGIRLLGLTDTVQLMGQIGIIFIMFVAGLEIDVQQLNQNRGKTLRFGLLTFSIPLTIGILGALCLGVEPMSAVLLASMFSSHTLLTYPTVSKYGLAQDSSVTVAVGGTVITNFLAMMVLAVVAAFHTQKGDWGGLWLMAGTSSVYLVGLFLLPKLAGPSLRRLSEDPDLQFLLVFLLLFLASSLAVPAGLEPVIGAFFAGLLLNRHIPNASLLMNRVQFIGYGLFIPLFLLYVGFLVDFRHVPYSPRSWIMGGFMVGVALVSKWAAAWLGGKFSHFRPLQTRLMYGLSVNQAAGTLAAVLVGFKIGLFDQDIVSATIMMIVVTCMVGAWITHHSAKNLARQGTEARRSGTRIHRVLLPLSNPESADTLLEAAESFLPKSDRITVYPTVMVRDEPGNEGHIMEAESLLAKALMRFQHLPYPSQPITSLDNDFGHGLLLVARARRADTLILGWNPNFSLERRFFGSVLDKMIANANQRLVVLRPGRSKSSYRRIHLLLPLYSEAHSDLSGVLQLVLELRKNRGTVPIFYGHPRTREAMSRYWKGMPSSGALHWKPVLSNPKLETFLLSEKISPEDILAIVAARPGQAPWTPSLGRLPFSLAQSFPEPTFLVLYPEIRPETDNDDGLTTEGRLEERVLVGPQEDSLEKDLQRAFQECFPPDQLEALVHTLAHQAREDALELRPGHLFIHQHIPETVTFLVRHFKRNGGWLTFLLSPETESHENHLRVLSQIVRKIRNGTPPFDLAPLNQGSRLDIVS